MRSPQMIEFAPDMTLASVRLYGDPEFVKSTEALIRVHAEIHHSRGVDSTELREPLCRRITRGSEAEACLLLSFIPVRLSVSFLMPQLRSDPLESTQFILLPVPREVFGP